MLRTQVMLPDRQQPRMPALVKDREAIHHIDHRRGGAKDTDPAIGQNLDFGDIRFVIRVHLQPPLGLVDDIHPERIGDLPRPARHCGVERSRQIAIVPSQPTR